MTRLNDPPRLTQSVAAPASLRRAIRLAARLEPTPQDLQQLASSLLTLRPATASREPARGTEQSGFLRSTRRKTFIAARLAAAILAACFSVTWAGMRFWSSSNALRAWIAPVETVAHTAPSDRPPVDLAPRPVGVELLAPAIVATDRLARPAPKHGKARVAVHDTEPAQLAAPEPSTAAVEAPPPPAPELPSEAQLLLRARNALRFDSAQALRWVREHEQRFPDGALCQEREILAIAALRGIGRSTEARARLARFRERYPLSIHDRRIDNRVIDRAHQDGQGQELSPE